MTVVRQRKKEHSNTEDESPALGFDRGKLVDILAERISNHFSKDDHGIERSLTIGIHGEWGSGKSTVLEELAQHKIFKQSEEKITLPVRFNTWRYEKEVHLIIPLLKTAQLAIKTYTAPLDAEDTFKERLLESANSLGQVAISLAAGVKFGIGIPGIAKFGYDVDNALKKAREESESDQDEEKDPDSDSLYFDVHRQLENITGRNKDNEDTFRLNLLFLIDDLDRCLPEKAVEMMESIKLFLDVEGCAFVLALDEEVVERGILHRYRDYVFNSEKEEQNKGLSPNLPITDAEYLEKIIQLPVKLPLPTEGQLREFLKQHYFDINSSDEEKFFNTNKIQQEDVLKLFLEAIPAVPRKHVRAAELYLLTRDIAHARGFKIDPVRLAQFILLQLFAPDLFRYGRQHHTFMSTLKRWALDFKKVWMQETFLNNSIDAIRQKLEAASKPEKTLSQDDVQPDKKITKEQELVKGQEKVETDWLSEITDDNILNLEESLSVFKKVRETCKGRSGFDPRNLITEVDKNKEKEGIKLQEYYSLTEQVSAAEDNVAEIKDLQRFVARPHRVAGRRRAWRRPRFSCVLRSRHQWNPGF